MFKSILLAATRHLVRNKTFSLINLLGMSVSMSLCMLIILIVREQFTYDNFHLDSEHIYQVNSKVLLEGGGSFDFASVPMPLAKVLKEDYTFSEQVAGLNRFVTDNARAGQAAVSLEGLFADPAFLSIFNFPLETGLAQKALDDPKGVVLTADAARKLFGSADPMGKTVSVGTYGDFIVTGVLQPLKGKTHLEFEALLPKSALIALENSGALPAVSDNWNEVYSSFVYIRMKANSGDQARLGLSRISEAHGKNIRLEEGYTGYQFYLRPLDDITPGASVFNQMGPGIPASVLVFLGALATVVLVMSVFNFTNLMIAKSLTRAREIGVRKIVGAGRMQVFSQFIGESLVFVFIALACSYVLLQFLKRATTMLWLSSDFPLSLEEDLVSYILFTAFGIMAGILAGVLPATYLSAFRPLHVLKESGNVRIYSKLTLRKALIVTQFASSIIFVITVLIIYRQVNFMINSEYGFNKENVINVPIQNTAFERLASRMSTLAGVRAVGGVSHTPGTWNSRSGSFKRKIGDDVVSVSQYIADDRYVANLQLTYLAGENFDATNAGSGSFVILNEQAVKAFQFETPQAALNETVLFNDSVPLRVRGVVRDFHYRPLSDNIGPLAFRYDPSAIGVMSVWIDPAQKQQVLASLQSHWKEVNPEQAMTYSMMEDDLADAYRQSGMADLLIITGYMTVLAVILACLGMLGMSLYATQTRAKEIGIRKVQGASTFDLVWLLTSSFMKMIGIAALIGLPVSILIGDQFLSSFAYRIGMGPFLFAGGIGLIVLLGLLMAGSQALKAARVNPVQSLRQE